MNAPVFRGCECDCQHLGAPESHADPAAAPLAYRVERAGEELAICTCCLHENDRIVTVLASTENDPDVFGSYDPYGFYVLTRNMKDRGLLDDPTDIIGQIRRGLSGLGDE